MEREKCKYNPTILSSQDAEKRAETQLVWHVRPRMEWVGVEACFFSLFANHMPDLRFNLFFFNPLILHAKICLLLVRTGGYLSATMRQNISICRSLLDKKFSFSQESNAMSWGNHFSGLPVD